LRGEGDGERTRRDRGGGEKIGEKSVVHDVKRDAGHQSDKKPCGK